MRFVFLTLGYHPDQFGGAYRYVRETAAHLARRGHAVCAIYPIAGDRGPMAEVRDGVALRRYPDQTGPFWQNWQRENALAREQLETWQGEGAEPAVIVACHGYFEPALKGARYVSLFTGPWAEEFRFSRQAVARPLWRRLLDELVARRLRSAERAMLRRAHEILTISEYYLKQLPVWHPGKLPPVRNISGGVDAQQFAPVTDRGALRQRLGISEGESLFLAVRRLDPRMGLRGLLEAFVQVNDCFPQARLNLAGTGPQEADLASLIERLGLGKQVRLLGRVSDAELVEWLNAADCTLMPSLDLEGFGLSTVESLACGTPVLGSDAGATAELLRPLSEELIFSAGSANALASKLERILQNPMLLPARIRCREYVMQRYSWDNVASALETAGRAMV